MVEVTNLCDINWNSIRPISVGCQTNGLGQSRTYNALKNTSAALAHLLRGGLALTPFFIPQSQIKKFHAK